MRDKFNLIIAEHIEPKMEASRYMDREENENELKQVLGDTDCAYNLSPEDLLIRGKSGMLVVGPNARKVIPPAPSLHEHQAPRTRPFVRHLRCLTKDRGGSTRSCWCAT